MLLTVDGVGRVLDLFSMEEPERGVTEVAELLGISRSKAHAQLSSLAAIGLLQRVDGGRYRVGLRTLSLARVAIATTPWRPAAVQAGTALFRRYGEAVHLATIQDGQVLYVERVTGPRSLRLPSTTRGSLLPAHCSGVGKVLLAGLPVAEADDVLHRRGLPPLTPATITDREALRETLCVVRDRGYAEDHDEALDGVSCVAAPVVDQVGRTVAALSISAPTPRLRARPEEVRRAVVGAAREASRQLCVVS